MQFKQDGAQMLLSSGRSRFKLATLPAADYPRLEIRGELTSVSLAKGPLQDAISKTQFAMAQQDVRYYLNGNVCFRLVVGNSVPWRQTGIG